MYQLAPGWKVAIERGPGWLLARICCGDDDPPQANLADGLWSLMEQQFVNRLVLDLDGLPPLDDHAIDQLDQLRLRIFQRGGMLRICGLSDENGEALQSRGFDSQLPRYRTREEAIMGFRPAQPR